MNLKTLYFTLFFIVTFISTTFAQTQHSVARQWNEVLLEAIRKDFARPTVHARNLFHTSMAMYDAWAVYDENAETIFLGKEFGGVMIPFDSIASPEDMEIARQEAISYAAFRILKHRFKISPGRKISLPLIDSLFISMGYDSTFVSSDYQEGSGAALGNYIAEQVIAFGLQDGANEANDYVNRYYRPWNPPLVPSIPGNRFFFNQNRWQPLTFDIFIDQSGNPFPGGAPEFLGPEWGRVVPFALKEEDLNIYERNNGEYWVYHDPGDPCYIETRSGGGLTEEYKWGFSLVSKWGSHLDPDDGVLWDISPASIGNIPVEDYPTEIPDYRNFYLEEGGDISQGHELNPHTGQPYEPQIVPRGDYTRILAEFWADGPESETPPGHWFTILNYVSDHSEIKKQFKGEGRILDDLEWDVKSYLILGGAMHDCAITAWGIKGWYDYPRPVSTIRWMADQGQSSDPNLPSYNINGLNLEPGLIELVEAGDSLAREDSTNIGKIKLYTWRGPDYIINPDSTKAGVDWILGENWWPYQRPTFVTPPFAGYISGHSTFSRAAAEVMTMLTGDAFFPGGMGAFEAKKNEFLVFEDGPSVDITLQWATYRDASDQTSLSRIWGGIHPPVDDIPGRLIGMEIGPDAFNYAEQFFHDTLEVISSTQQINEASITIAPNPVISGQSIQIQLNSNLGSSVQVELYDINGRLLQQQQFGNATFLEWNLQQEAGVYLIRLLGEKGNVTKKVVLVE